MDDVEALPELLRIRILRGFKEPGGNAVIDLQRALGRYWMSVSELMSFLPSCSQMFQLNLPNGFPTRLSLPYYAVIEVYVA